MHLGFFRDGWSIYKMISVVGGCIVGAVGLVVAGVLFLHHKLHIFARGAKKLGKTAKRGKGKDHFH